MNAGDRIGPWTIVRPLGEGGMGAVYLAERSDSPEIPRVALKVLHRHMLTSDEFRRRFTREVTAAGRVVGPFVAALIEADVDAAEPWLATEFVDGPNLREQVERRGQLQGDGLRSFVIGLAHGLASIHEAGIIHRDLTPGNVLLGPNGPRVVDFGIATMPDASTITQTGGFIGTPAWMSPEQLTEDRATPASDIWAWGATATYAALGRPAVDASRPEVVLYRVLEGKLDLDGLPSWLDGPVRASMQTAPTDRPTAADLVGLVGDGIDDRAAWATRQWRRAGPALVTPAPPGARPSSPPSGGAGADRTSTSSGQSPLVLAVGFVALTILAAAVTVMARGGLGEGSEPSPSPPATAEAGQGPSESSDPEPDPTTSAPPQALLEDDGLAIARFGDPADEVVATLSAVFGPPTTDVTEEQCIRPTRWVDWSHLQVEFAPGPTGDFVAYSYDIFGTITGDPHPAGISPDLTTAGGVTLNSWVEDLREEFPGIDLTYDDLFQQYFFQASDSPAGLGGLTSGPEDSDQVEQIRAGSTRCGE